MNSIASKIFLIIISSFLTLNIQASDVSSKSTEAYFSPKQGKLVFEKIYNLVKSSKESTYITLYSWSDSKLKDAIEEALKNGAEVKVVLHPPLYREKETVKKWVEDLEAKGAEFKIAKMNMHEKIVIVDNKVLINSSANMTSGPKSSYAENWVFHYLNKVTKNIFVDFTQEFTILWNTAADITTHDEPNSDVMNYPSIHFTNNYYQNNPPKNNNALLFSSSMNFKIKKNKTTSKEYLKGKYWKMMRKKDSQKNNTWFVRDAVLANLKKANTSIKCAFNHVFINEIAVELISAVKRGVDVKLAVDNQEYSSGETKNFVKMWKKLKGNKKKTPPVRVRTYSHRPSYYYWQLNHHKYCLVDYGTNNEILINGSYNFSETAEHKQFDNQVIYKGKEFKNLYGSFNNDFNFLYSENRTEDDKPSEEILNLFLTPTEYGAYPLHINKAVSLTWNELRQLRGKVNKLAPGILRTPNQKRHCKYYKYIKMDGNQVINKYYGCPN